MYTFDARVRYSETDQSGNLTLGGILDYFQDTSTFEAEDNGIGMEFLLENNRVWLLSGWQVLVERYPFVGEKIRINTFPYDFKNFFGMRNFTLQDEEEKVIAKANTIWTLMDTEKGCPCRISPQLLEHYQIGERLEMEYEPRKIELAEKMQVLDAVEIKEHHLDTNGHVNNAQYVKIAEEIAGVHDVVHLRADYRKSARMGDTMLPSVGSDGLRKVVCFKEDDGTIYAIVEFRLKM